MIYMSNLWLFISLGFFLVRTDHFKELKMNSLQFFKEKFVIRPSGPLMAEQSPNNDRN